MFKILMERVQELQESILKQQSYLKENLVITSASLFAERPFHSKLHFCLLRLLLIFMITYLVCQPLGSWLELTSLTTLDAFKNHMSRFQPSFTAMSVAHSSTLVSASPADKVEITKEITRLSPLCRLSLPRPRKLSLHNR